MRSPPKKSPSSKARELPLPRSKRTDPPVPRIPTDPRTWHESRRAFGWAPRHYFSRPRPPFHPDHPVAYWVVAECVVREVELALGLARFPRRRWADWLGRRMEGLYRIERKVRARLDGPHGREHCYALMRHWLYIGLRKSGAKHADELPQEMWAGHPPLGYGVTSRSTGRDRKAKAA